MALTPEDVVNKRFQPTKFREGYDQDEVDDFLDEVVVELRRLDQENEELRQRLAGAPRSAAAGPAAAAEQPAPAPTPRARARAGPASAAAPEPRAASPPPAPTTTVDPRRGHRGHQQPPAARSSSARGARPRGRREARRAHRRGPRHGRPPRRRGRGEAAPDHRRHREHRTASASQVLEQRASASSRASIDELRTFERDYRAEAQELHRGPAPRARRRSGTEQSGRSPAPARRRASAQLTSSTTEHHRAKVSVRVDRGTGLRRCRRPAWRRPGRKTSSSRTCRTGRASPSSAVPCSSSSCGTPAPRSRSPAA